MKGVMLANWIYLIIFLFLYFISLPTLQNVLGIIADVFPSEYSDIPASTWFLMNLLAYVLVPLGAIAWTILSSRPQEQPYGYGYR